MKQKKNKVLVVTIMILFIVIILLVGIMVYLYFFTDLFKSNKQLFFKYTSQLVQKEDAFIRDDVIQYFQKKQNTSYENSGDITFNVEIPNLEEAERTNNLNIHFTGKTNEADSKAEREISLNYSEDVNFPLTYRKTGTIMGIQTQYLGSSFVAIRSDEELTGFEELYALTAIQNLESSQEEIQNLKTTYFDTILNTLDDNHFSNVTEGELTGYTLTLTGDEFKDILEQILNALKTDENTIHKINTILNAFGGTVQLNADYIDELIETIRNELEITNTIEITVYANQENLTRIDIGIEGNTLTINKEGNDQQITYHIAFNQADSGVSTSISITYSGLNSDNVHEIYEITMQGPYEENNQNTTQQETTSHYQYTITNNVQFVDSVDIEDLTEENAVILNDRENEYVTNLMNTINQRLIDVNRVHMEKLGISENENPIQYLIPTFLRPEQTTQLDEMEINTFNQKFELYESTNTRGATVKGLLTTIQNNNETEGNYKIEEINVDGEEYEVTEQNITLLKSSINVEDSYRVEFEKDINTGLIYRAVINKR